MNALLYISSAVFAVLTAVFAFVVTKLLTNQRTEVAQQFTYTQDKISTISGDVKALHTKLDTTLMPKLDAVYGQLSEPSPSLTPSYLIDIFKSAHLSAVQVANGDNPLLFAGFDHEGVNVSLFIGFHVRDPVIAFRSFAFAPSSLPEPALLALLKLNAITAASAVGVIPLGNRYLITADAYFPAPTQVVDPQIVLRLSKTLLDRQLEILKILREYDVTPTQMLANEYVDALPSDPKSGRKLIFIGASLQDALARQS